MVVLARVTSARAGPGPYIMVVPAAARPVPRRAGISRSRHEPGRLGEIPTEYLPYGVKVTVVCSRGGGGARGPEEGGER